MKMKIDKFLIHYYSYDNNGQATISAHYYDYNYCKEYPYAVLDNGGVAMFWMTEAEFGVFAALCARMKVVIDTINEH